ncbi:hypothetical protein EAG_14947 [Camponotus floridanus]|uniref:Uncharacterized protein n=1 Tax=Camponotus floridanus TaxID=104421 RepID=E2ATK2_CAMFO|nr:hypothetical protein EAG_14947 [Camponotus floridanus]
MHPCTPAYPQQPIAGGCRPAEHPPGKGRALSAIFFKRSDINDKAVRKVLKRRSAPKTADGARTIGTPKTTKLAVGSTLPHLGIPRVRKSRRILSEYKQKLARSPISPGVPGPRTTPFSATCPTGAYGGPVRQQPIHGSAEPEKRVSSELLPWKLHRIDLEPPRYTRPPRHLLEVWDVRMRRYTSPTGRSQELSRHCRLHHLAGQPELRRRQQRVHRATQASFQPPTTAEQGTQSDSDWESTTQTAATQTEPAAEVDEKNNRPGKKADENINRPRPALRYTKALPSISYRKRL